MLKEPEFLMVPPNRESCGIDLNVHLLCGRVDSMKRAPAFNGLQHQRRPPQESFDLGVPGVVATGGGGGGGECLREDNAEEEVEDMNGSDDRILAPSSPPIATAAAVASASSSPIVHGGLSEIMNSTGDFGSSRAPAQNGWPANENGSEANESGFVGTAEKRTRNGGSLASHSAAVSAGNQSGESFQEDCPGLPSRKRLHVSDDSTVDGLGRRESDVGVSVDRVESSEGNKSVSPGVITPTKLDEGKLSDGKMSPYSELKGGVTPVQIEEVNGERAHTTEEAVPVNNGEDVEMLSADEEAKARLWESEERPILGSGDEDRPDVPADGKISEEGFVDMDVDPVGLENIEPVGVEVVAHSASPRAGEQEGATQLQEQPVLERDAENLLGNRSGSPDLRPPPPSDTGERKERERSHQENPRRHRPLQQVPRDVEVIQVDDSDDDDDDDDEEEEDDEDLREGRAVYESDASSTKGKKPISSQGGEQHRQRNGYRFYSSESTAPSHNADDDSDSDDCRVLESHPPPNANGHRYRDGAANPVLVQDDDDYNYTTTEDTDSSDVEEVGVSQSDIRRRWEEAAMRRRMGRAMQSAGSKANASQGGTVNLDDQTESQGLEESVATSTYRNSPDSKDQTETSEARGGVDGGVHRTAGIRGTALRADKGQRPVMGSHGDDILNIFDEAIAVKSFDTPADSGRQTVVSSPGSDQDDLSGSKSVKVQTPCATDLDRVKTWSTAVQSANQKGEASSRNSDDNVDERLRSKYPLSQRLENGTSDSQDVDAIGVEAETSIAREDLLAGKERLKQTDHYRKTDAEEWASRQQEIERQAAESKRLRQRKRQEADRKKEMERKQKERIEELRLSQRKEERQMDLRDQLRGQVRAELERIAGTCSDFATLLRKLGIPVEGGSRSSTQQVNAAYKKALFKFHPDRAVASSQGEPRKQVEAEEKFKLIQRLKDTLTPVTIDYTYPTYRSFF